MMAIEAHALSKQYGPRAAVQPLSLAIERGEAYGLLGANGAGKTTTLRMLVGALEPSSGRALIHGAPVPSPEVWRKIGVVFGENLSPEPHHSPRRYLRYFGRVMGMRQDAWEVRVASLAKLLRLEADLHRPIGALSGGTRRKVEIARALLHRPAVLFLDEPTRELDLPTRRAVWRALVEERRAQGLTLFLCSHDAEEIAQLCDRVAVLRQGQVAWEAQPSLVAGNASDLAEVLASKLEDASEA